MKLFLRSLTVLGFSSLAFADHVPGVGLNYSGTWVVLIAVGVIFSLLILSILWAVLDGQFQNSERVKFAVALSDDTFVPSIERPQGKEVSYGRAE
jgi:nitrogen fixation-related uncharacterized protein